MSRAERRLRRSKARQSVPQARTWPEWVKTFQSPTSELTGRQREQVNALGGTIEALASLSEEDQAMVMAAHTSGDPRLKEAAARVVLEAKRALGRPPEPGD